MLLCESFFTNFVFLREIFQKAGSTAVNINAKHGRSALYESFRRYLNFKRKRKEEEKEEKEEEKKKTEKFLLTMAASFHGHKVQLDFLQ